jgi:hypothetical protein
MSSYPTAEHLARHVQLSAGTTIDGAMMSWADAYRDRYRNEPSDGQAKAARLVLETRLRDEPPPLPSSASSCTWAKLPELTPGIPD